MWRIFAPLAEGGRRPEASAVIGPGVRGERREPWMAAGLRFSPMGEGPLGDFSSGFLLQATAASATSSLLCGRGGGFLPSDFVKRAKSMSSLDPLFTAPILPRGLALLLVFHASGAFFFARLLARSSVEQKAFPSNWNWSLLCGNGFVGLSLAGPGLRCFFCTIPSPRQPLTHTHGIHPSPCELLCKTGSLYVFVSVSVSPTQSLICHCLFPLYLFLMLALYPHPLFLSLPAPASVREGKAHH